MGVDRAQAIHLTTWILMISMCLTVILKVSSKLMKARTLHLDDYCIIAGMVFGIAYTVATSQQVQHGLGSHQEALRPTSVTDVEQALYASQIVYIPTVALQKLASAIFVATLSRKPKAKPVGRAIGISCILYMTVGIIALAFQCSMPSPWRVFGNSCFDRVLFWSFMAALDVLLDAALVLLAMYILWSLQMPWKLKTPVIAAFASRLLIIPATTLRVVYLARAYGSLDSTYDFYAASISSQFTTHLGIMLACLPFLKKVTDSMEHGLFTSDLRYAPGVGHSHGSKLSYALRSMARFERTPKDNGSAGKEERQHKDGPYRGNVPITSTAAEGGPGRQGSSESTAMFIQKQTTLWVEPETV